MAKKETTARADLEHGCHLYEEGQFELAFECFLKAAKRGCLEAQVNLGNLYDEGKGCQKDSKKAVYWYKRAIRVGLPYGAYNLGVHYRQQNKRRWAIYWFQRAADMGDEDALIEIEKMG